MPKKVLFALLALALAALVLEPACGADLSSKPRRPQRARLSTPRIHLARHAAATDKKANGIAKPTTEQLAKLQEERSKRQTRLASLIKERSSRPSPTKLKDTWKEVSKQVLDKFASELTEFRPFSVSHAGTSKVLLFTAVEDTSAATKVEKAMQKHSIPPTQCELYYEGKPIDRKYAKMFGGNDEPMRAGMAVTHSQAASYGTMGAFLLDNNRRLYGLSARHVLKTTLDELISQPGAEMLRIVAKDQCIAEHQGLQEECTAAANAKDIPLHFLGSLAYSSAKLDAGLAHVFPKHAVKCAIPGKDGALVGITGQAKPQAGEFLWKFGASTHFTTGTLGPRYLGSQLSVVGHGVPTFADSPGGKTAAGFAYPTTAPFFWDDLVWGPSEHSLKSWVKKVYRARNLPLDEAEADAVCDHLYVNDAIKLFSTEGDSGSAVMAGTSVVGILSSGFWHFAECSWLHRLLWTKTINGITWCAVEDVTLVIPISDIIEDINANTQHQVETAHHNGMIASPVSLCTTANEAQINVN